MREKGKRWEAKGGERTGCWGGSGNGVEVVWRRSSGSLENTVEKERERLLQPEKHLNLKVLFLFLIAQGHF